MYHLTINFLCSKVFKKHNTLIKFIQFHAFFFVHNINIFFIALNLLILRFLLFSKKREEISENHFLFLANLLFYRTVTIDTLHHNFLILIAIKVINIFLFYFLKILNRKSFTIYISNSPNKINFNSTRRSYVYSDTKRYRV